MPSLKKGVFDEEEKVKEQLTRGFRDSVGSRGGGGRENGRMCFLCYLVVRRLVGMMVALVVRVIEHTDPGNRKRNGSARLRRGEGSQRPALRPAAHLESSGAVGSIDKQYS